MKHTKQKRRRVSGVFEIRAAKPHESGATQGTGRFESGAAHRSLPGEGTPVVCLLIPVNLFHNDET